MIETDILLVSCAELKSTLHRRQVELERLKHFHTEYQAKMAAHRQSVELAETSLDSRHDTRELNERLHQLNTDSKSLVYSH